MQTFLKRFYDKDCDVNNLSPLALAFIGDSVFDLFVREKLICQANCPVSKLHENAVKQVRCETQAESLKKLLPILTDKEVSVYKRGRNAHTSHKPKNASSEQYHIATGFEAMIGYIYLRGDIDRLREIFEFISK